MSELEHEVHKKVAQDFATEIAMLDKGLDTIVRCAQILIQEAPLLDKPNLRINLMRAKPEDRCSVTHTLLVYHASAFLRSARLLLLTGYISPSLSCLRTTFESIQNAHICLNNDQQAMRLLNGRYLDKTTEIEYPIQMRKDIAKEIKITLSDHGVHATYQALVTQGLYEGSMFVSGNRGTYEFLFLRNIYSFLSISMLFLDYLIDAKPFLKKEIPSVTKIIQSMIVKTEEIAVRLKEMDESKLET